MTLHEAADRLGLHYMTVYRYVTTGRLDGVKEGAEWRVSAAEVEGLAKSPPSSGAGRGRRRVKHSERLQKRLVIGDLTGSWSVVEAALGSGLTPAEIYLEVLTPAMVGIGEGWIKGTYTVAQEHEASAVASRLMGRLSPRFNRRGRKRGSVVLGAPVGDDHNLPIALLADLLRGEGFRVHDLGHNVPAESFVEVAVGAERLVTVGLGATKPDNGHEIRLAICALNEASTVPVFLGGGAIVDAEHARRLGADAWTASTRDALSLVETVASEGMVPNGTIP